MAVGLNGGSAAVQPEPEPSHATVAVGRDGLLGLRGADLGRTRWRRLSQSMIAGFADVTGDHEWIHVDVARAATGPFGGTIAHGFLTLALLPVLQQELLVVSEVPRRVNYGLNRVRFPAPAPADSAVRGWVVIDDVQAHDDTVDVITTTTVESSNGGKPVCIAQMISRNWV
jgi:acyl dehydratase